MDEFDKALSNWHAAESVWFGAELAFSRAVYLYVAGRACAPTAESAVAVAAARLTAMDALSVLWCAHYRSRFSLPLI